MGTDGEINKEPDQRKVIDQGNPVHEKIDNEPVSDRSELILMLLQFWQKIYSNTIIIKTIRKILFIILITIIIIFVFSWFIYIVPAFSRRPAKVK